MLNVKKANKNKPPKVMIYGEPGVGKSTFGAKAENPIFISAEDGAETLITANGEAVDEFQNINTWDDIRKAIRSLINEDHNFKTLVLDSADWIEQACHAKIIGNSDKDIIRVNGGYNSGYRDSERLHKELLGDLTELRDKKNMAIVVIAHSHVKTVKDPDMVHDYDGFEIKCNEKVSSLWIEWTNALFFARFSTFTSQTDDNKKARALGDDTRVVYTVKRPAFQAKNRYGMPPEMPFTENFWNEFMEYAKKGIKAETSGEIMSEIIELTSEVKDEATQKIIMDTTEKAGDNVSELKKIRTRLQNITGKGN